MQENTLFVVYTQFFAVVEKLFKKNYRAEATSFDVNNFFIRELTEMGLRSAERSAVMSFYKIPIGVLNTNFEPRSTAIIKVSVRALYERLCHIIGPVEADKLFAQSLDKVSTSNAGRVFSPRKYLL